MTPSTKPAFLRILPWMSVFFMAMAYLESAVVVYLRALYYPEGFDFPLVPMDNTLVGTELGREAATILMLLAVPALVTRSALERFAWFCFGFGVWDIFYYVWLKVLLDWPSSLFSRDLLFLIPVPWVGPVWAPCVISLGLIATAVVILHGRSRNPCLPHRAAFLGLAHQWRAADDRLLHHRPNDALLRRERTDGQPRRGTHQRT